MNILKNHSVRWIFVLFITGFVGCTNSDSNNITNEIVQVTAEDVFKGIFFLESNFAQQIPILSNSSVYEVLDNMPDVREYVDKIGNLVVQNIHYNHPNYFDEFQSKMKSRNPYDIQNAIDSGVLKLQESFKDIFEMENMTPETLKLILDEENIGDFITPEGNIDKLAFQNLLEKNMSNLDDVKLRLNGKCINVSLVITTVAVLAVAVLVGAVVAIAAAVNGGFLVNLGVLVNVHAAINIDVEINTDYVNGGGGGQQRDGPGGVAKVNDRLQSEILVDQLAQFEY